MGLKRRLSEHGGEQRDTSRRTLVGLKHTNALYWSDQIEPFQTDPCGVEASDGEDRVHLRVASRRTRVGLKHLSGHQDGDVHLLPDGPLSGRNQTRVAYFVKDAGLLDEMNVDHEPSDDEEVVFGEGTTRRANAMLIRGECEISKTTNQYCPEAACSRRLGREADARTVRFRRGPPRIDVGVRVS